ATGCRRVPASISQVRHCRAAFGDRRPQAADGPTSAARPVAGSAALVPHLASGANHLDDLLLARLEPLVEPDLRLDALGALAHLVDRDRRRDQRVETPHVPSAQAGWA